MYLHNKRHICQTNNITNQMIQYNTIKWAQSHQLTFNDTRPNFRREILSHGKFIIIACNRMHRCPLEDELWDVSSWEFMAAVHQTTTIVVFECVEWCQLMLAQREQRGYIPKLLGAKSLPSAHGTIIHESDPSNPPSLFPLFPCY